MYDVSTLIKEITIIAGALIPIVIAIIYLMNGMKCLLLNKMLRIYYHHHETKIIRQYELENFVHLYKAYKALRGNSFVDKIYKEVMEWEVVT